MSIEFIHQANIIFPFINAILSGMAAISIFWVAFNLKRSGRRVILLWIVGTIVFALFVLLIVQMFVGEFTPTLLFALRATLMTLYPALAIMVLGLYKEWIEAMSVVVEADDG